MEEYEPGSIRTYLMQMGDIPLLTRREELATAQRIERTRRILRARSWKATTSCDRPSAFWTACSPAACGWSRPSTSRSPTRPWPEGCCDGLKPTGGPWNNS